MRSNEKRKMPESPMDWSECPKCKEPFSESHDGPLPGQRTYIHSNGDRHVEPLEGAIQPVPPRSATEKQVPFSGASGAGGPGLK